MLLLFFSSIVVTEEKEFVRILIQIELYWKIIE